MLCAYPKGSIASKQETTPNKICHRAVCISVPVLMHSSFLLDLQHFQIAIANGASTRNPGSPLPHAGSLALSTSIFPPSIRSGSERENLWMADDTAPRGVTFVIAGGGSRIAAVWAGS